MLELLKFVLTDGYTFTGTILLVSLTGLFIDKWIYTLRRKT